jgi:hypothetical protein
VVLYEKVSVLLVRTRVSISEYGSFSEPWTITYSLDTVLALKIAHDGNSF